MTNKRIIGDIGINNRPIATHIEGVNPILQTPRENL